MGTAIREMKKVERPFTISTKSMLSDGSKLRRELEQSLRRLNVETIDYYNCWCLLTLDDWERRKRGGAVAEILKAREEGLIADINDPLSEYLPAVASHPDKSGITIRHLLMMQSGIDYSNDGVEGQTDKVLRQLPDDITEFILERPVYTQPGVDFHYNDGDPQLLSAMIQHQAGKPTDEWADDVLFSKIGFENYNWIRYRDGVRLGGFGIETTPRELAKLALCVADSGNYKGHQVIPEQWLEEMLKEQVVSDEDYSFGYFWWIDTQREIPFMAGHGGQYAYIIPQKELVVIMTAIPNTQGDHQINFTDATPIIDRIISICQ